MRYDWKEDHDLDFYIGDSIRGIVNATGKNGIYITLENNETAFCYGWKLLPGTEISCTICGRARNGLLTKVLIDSYKDAIA